MITRLAALWRRARAFLIVLAAFASGVGIYAGWQAIETKDKWLVFWPWLVAGAIPLITLGAWWLWWQLPKRQAERLRMTIRDAKARADVEDNFRKTMGQLLGGAAVLIGAVLAYVQYTQQRETAREQLQTTIDQFTEQQKTARDQINKQQKASSDLLISNQVAKGFELLGHKDKDEITLRLGGIYALEGVMKTSEQYHKL